MDTQDHVSREGVLGKIFPALGIGEGNIVGPIALGCRADTGLNDLGGDLRSIPAAEESGITRMVIVGVRANDPTRHQTIPIQQGGESLAIQTRHTGVQQDDVRFIETVDADQRRGCLRNPGISQNMPQFHGFPSGSVMNSLYTN